MSTLTGKIMFDKSTIFFVNPDAAVFENYEFYPPLENHEFLDASSHLYMSESKISVSQHFHCTFALIHGYFSPI